MPAWWWHRGSRAVPRSGWRPSALSAGLTREQAVDVLWLLNSPAAFAQLVRRAGWSLDDYEDWLAGAMVRELLPPG